MRTSENARGAAGRAGEGASGPEKETRRSELRDDRGLLELATPSLLELVVRIAAACDRQGGGGGRGRWRTSGAQAARGGRAAQAAQAACRTGRTGRTGRMPHTPHAAHAGRLGPGRLLWWAGADALRRLLEGTPLLYAPPLLHEGPCLIRVRVRVRVRVGVKGER